MKKPKILLIDDDHFIRDLFRIVLGSENIDLIEAENATEAIAEVDKERPDVIIQDLHLPDMDGLELNVKLAELAKDIPIIALTGVQIKLGESALYKGFVTFMLKPLSPDDIMPVINQYLPSADSDIQKIQ